MLARHGVTAEEALEAAKGAPLYEAGGGDLPGQITRAGQDRYEVHGKTGAGRRLRVIFVDMGGGIAKIITAIPLGGRAQEKRHRKQRGE
jgi:hypothetical protein